VINLRDLAIVNSHDVTAPSVEGGEQFSQCSPESKSTVMTVKAPTTFVA
jgi:hypothetical protein